MKTVPYLFDDFKPGGEIGRHSAVYDDALAIGWRRIFGPAQPSGVESAGVAVTLMMRSYLAVVTPRLPGNVHARQQMCISALPCVGESVLSVVSCAGKEIRRERRYVELAVQASGAGGRPLFEGQLTLVWAA